MIVGNILQYLANIYIDIFRKYKKLIFRLYKYNLENFLYLRKIINF